MELSDLLRKYVNILPEIRKNSQFFFCLWLPKHKIFHGWILKICYLILFIWDCFGKNRCNSIFSWFAFEIRNSLAADFLKVSHFSHLFHKYALILLKIYKIQAFFCKLCSKYVNFLVSAFFEMGKYFALYSKIFGKSAKLSLLTPFFGS